jgi:hypothetical protein
MGLSPAFFYSFTGAFWWQRKMQAAIGMDVGKLAPTRDNFRVSQR